MNMRMVICFGLFSVLLGLRLGGPGELFAHPPRLVLLKPAQSAGDTIILGSDQEISPDSPQKAQDAVRALIASLWELDESQVVLEWRESRGVDIPEDFSGVELVGNGRHGHWVVAFSPESPEGSRVQAMVRAGAEVQRPVANRPLVRGELLGEGDLRYETEVHWGGPPTGGAEAAVGWVVQRSMRSGEPLTRPAVAPPKVVQAGQQVRIMWRSGEVTLTLQGKASGAAELGQKIYVRTESGHRLRGVALGPGLVKVLDASGEEVR